MVMLRIMATMSHDGALQNAGCDQLLDLVADLLVGHRALERLWVGLSALQYDRDLGILEDSLDLRIGHGSLGALGVHLGRGVLLVDEHQHALQAGLELGVLGLDRETSAEEVGCLGVLLLDREGLSLACIGPCCVDWCMRWRETRVVG